MSISPQPVQVSPQPGDQPPWFEVSQSEYAALTEGAALVDRSDRGKLAMSGPEAVEFLHGQITNDVRSLSPGNGCYAAFLTPKGMMVGDLRVLAVAAGEAEAPVGEVEPDSVGELLLDTERLTLQPLFEMIHRFRIGYRFELHKRTLERALLRVAGPKAQEALATVADRVGSLPSAEHAHLAAAVAGVAARLVRCEAGEVELLFASEQRERVAAALAGAGVTAVPPEAFEVVRIERGIPRYGFELDQRTIPQEAGLNERAVSFTKGCYVGQETVARLYYKGKPNRHLRGLRLERPVPQGSPILCVEREVGRVGSCARSPRLGPIALALLRREAQPGMAVSVTAPEGPVAGVVVELPFL